MENQTKIIEEASEKQTKATEGKVEKQLLDTDQKSITGLFSKHFLSEKAVYEFNEIKEIEPEINRDDLVHKTGNKKRDKAYGFQKLKTKRFFGRETYSVILTQYSAIEEQANLKDANHEFKESTKSKITEKKRTKNTDS